MVEQRKVDYVNSKRLDKPLVALDIIRAWRAQSPPGRFLKYDELPDTWSDVGDKKAREKTSQALREKAPLLRKQQEEQRRDSGVGVRSGSGSGSGSGNDSPGVNGISPDRVGPSMIGIGSGSRRGPGHGHGHGHGHHRSRRGGKGGSGSGLSGMLDRSTGMEPTEVCIYVCMYVCSDTLVPIVYETVLCSLAFFHGFVFDFGIGILLYLASCTSLSFLRNTLNMG